MKIIHICKSDTQGGAARAAFRIHQASLKLGIDSEMWVDDVQSGQERIIGPEGNSRLLRNKLNSLSSEVLRRLLTTDNQVLHSPELFSSAWVKRINNSDADIVHLHWVQGGMLSVRDIPKINKPIVWTIHDMWPFCGAEHYSKDRRWVDGYTKFNRPQGESGIDLNRWTWKRKLKKWTKPIQIVSPSKWIDTCVKESALMNTWPSTVVPNPIDTEKWKPISKEISRNILGLPQDATLVLFGAVGGQSDERKGFDLLNEALHHLENNLTAKKLNIELVVLGQSAPMPEDNIQLKSHYFGHLHDDISIRILLNAADVVVVPSRQDNLPNICLEALGCGTPLVAFDIGGFKDIIDHNSNGYLAHPFDTKDLAEGILCISNAAADKQEKISIASRKSATDRYSYKLIAQKYIEIYLSVLSKRIC